MDILDHSTIDPGTNEDAESPNGKPEYTDFRLILDAPDFATFIKRTKTPRVREYEKRTASALKAVALGAMQAEDFADAAAVLWFGPTIATAVGHVADTSERARGIIDIVTAPNSPWVALAVATGQLLAQFARNHEDELEKVPARFNMSRKARKARKAAKEAERTEQPPARFSIRIGRRRIPIRLQINPWRIVTAGIRAQTVDPIVVTSRVFTNKALLAELDKMGFKITPVARDG